MAEKSKTLSSEEIAKRRQQWELENPKLAEKRRNKKLQVIDDGKEVEVENHHRPSTREVNVMTRSRKIKRFKDTLCEKREQYLRDRYDNYEKALEDSKLSWKEKRFIKTVITYYYSHSEQELQPLAGCLLIEGLRYPDKELNDWSYNFLKEQNSKGILVYGFWFGVWNRGFVPNDVIRLMLEEKDGKYYPIPMFEDIARMNAGWIRKHLENEKTTRLEWARSLENHEEREKEIARKEKRIAFFEALIAAYEL